MALLENQASSHDSIMSDETFGMVNQFYDGIDDVIRDMVEETARRRMLKAGVTDLATIEIQSEDVKEVAKIMMAQLRGLPISFGMPPKLQQLLK